MSLSLTCDCGARFEVEDTLAGQTVACPECQAPIKAPVGQRPPLRTSTFALASTICALVGAFTVIGTLAAVVLGIVALVGIVRQRDRLAGLGFAAFGIVAGILFTGVTVFAFTKAEVFGMSNWARAQSLQPLVDETAQAQALVTRPAFAITRPSETWEVLTGLPGDPLVRALDDKSDLVMVDMRNYAFIDVKVDVAQPGQDLLGYQMKMVSDLNPHHNPWEPPDDDEVIAKAVVSSSEEVAPSTKTGFKERKCTMSVGSGRQSWTVLVRLYHKGNKVYVVRCYGPKNQVKRVEADFDKALGSFAPK